MANVPWHCFPACFESTGRTGLLLIIFSKSFGHKRQNKRSKNWVQAEGSLEDVGHPESNCFLLSAGMDEF